MSELDLPFRAEYAKSGRASCKICKQAIEKGSLRLAVMVQSHRFDAKMPFWHHYNCFFTKKTITTVGDIAFFDGLRWEDQEKIKKKIAEGLGSANGTTSSGKKKSGSAADANLLEFSVEYAKSSKSACRHCDEKITKKEIRVSKMERDTETAMRFGPVPGWHHLDCFVKIRDDLGFTETGDKLPGFSKLEEEDQELVKSKIKAVGGAKKRKAEPEPEPEVPAKKKNEEKVEKAEEKLLKAQSKLVFSFRDKIESAMKKKDMLAILELNKQEAPPGESLIMNALSDCLAFGALKPCPECGGQLSFSNNRYKCSGYVTGWTKCAYETQKPERMALVIPDELKEDFEFLRKYKYVKRERIFPTNPELPAARASTSGASFKPLNKFKVAIVGTLKSKKSDAEALILKLGGKVGKKLDNTIHFVIASKDSTKNMDKHKGVESNKIYVVSEEILDDLENIYTDGMLPTVMKKHELFSWGKEPEEALPAVIRKKSEISGTKSVQKFKVHGKAAVDPSSGLEDTHHVVEKNKDVYNAVLGKVDIVKGRNSYYKLQLLKSNSRDQYVVFRAWGRVGTTIGDQKTEKFPTFEDALENFKAVYNDITKGNHWDDRDNFVKKPSGYYPIDIDYGQDDSKKIQDLKPGSNSKLDMPIQELITMIFDIEAMKKAMLEFEIDLKKMPLGKLSKKQIQNAYLVLTEVQNILKSDEKSSTKILDASNRFYTLIPHDFGLRKPPLLDNAKLLESKIEMLNSLLEIELAYNLLLESAATNEDPIDQHYNQLKTDIEILDKETDKFKRINTYLRNTHAPTHTQYKLQLDKVFKISRHGESERYQKFKKLHNKKLLWHGSRTTNFAGILSQGLRIAPPEAPATGYMFGKGIYFADMVSKSANYCFTNRANPTGLLLLCEVALGNMLERYDADYIDKLPKDKQSTKGIGRTQPDPKSTVTENDIEIPLGKPVTGDTKAQGLLYNEYIVYDINQVNIKYLLKVKFNWIR